MPGVDLHVHTTASDGRFTPAEIVRKAADLDLSFISICDHDTVAGIAPALAAAEAYPGLVVIPGVEISTDVPKGEVHMLGYFIDFNDAALEQTLSRLRDSRVIRGEEMVAKLAGLGIYVDWPRVREIAGGGAIGRPHIAQAMLEKGYIRSLREAFDKYLGRDGPAYVEREKLAPAQTVSLVLASGGLPVMAHPYTIPEPEPLIAELRDSGLVGIEAYYGTQTEEQTRGLVAIAERYGLIPTGGTDYHGIEEIGENRLGSVNVPFESPRRLIALARQRGLKTAQSAVYG